MGYFFVRNSVSVISVLQMPQLKACGVSIWFVILRELGVVNLSFLS